MNSINIQDISEIAYQIRKALQEEASHYMETAKRYAYNVVCAGAPGGETEAYTELAKEAYAAEQAIRDLYESSNSVVDRAIGAAMEKFKERENAKNQVDSES